MKSYFVPSTHLYLSVSESLNCYAAKYRELHEIQSNTVQLCLSRAQPIFISCRSRFVYSLHSGPHNTTSFLSILWEIQTTCFVYSGSYSFSGFSWKVPPELEQLPSPSSPSLSFLCLVRGWYWLSNLWSILSQPSACQIQPQQWTVMRLSSLTALYYPLHLYDLE